VAILPGAVNGKRIRPVFTGMAVGNLGNDVRRVVQDAVGTIRLGRGSGTIDVPLLLKRVGVKGSSVDCCVRLRGYWSSLGHYKAGELQDYRVLLYGTMEPIGGTEEDRDRAGPAPNDGNASDTLFKSIG
jgi:hypothetical protein